MALRRKFNGKYYYWDSQDLSKLRAEGRARALRKAGNKARVTYSEGRYHVWVRW